MSQRPTGKGRTHGQSAKRKSTAKPRPKGTRKPLRDKLGRFRKRPALPPRDARGRFVRSEPIRLIDDTVPIIFADQSRDRKAPGVTGVEYVYNVEREYADQEEFAEDADFYLNRVSQHFEVGYRNVVAVVVRYGSEGDSRGRGYGRGLVVGDFKIDGQESEIIGSRVFHNETGFRDRFEEIASQIAGPGFVVEKLIVSMYRGV